MKTNRNDILIITFWILIASIYAFFTKDLFLGKGLFVGILFTVPPTIYLGIRKRKNWTKIAFATIIFGGLYGFFLDFYAEYTKAWIVQAVFPKIFGIEPIDGFLGCMLMTMGIIAFYQHFSSEKVMTPVSKRAKYAVILGVTIDTFLLASYFFFPLLLSIRYPYAFIGAISMTVPIVFLLVKPQFSSRIILPSLFFFFVYFIFELLAVRNSYWVYPVVNYIGLITVFNLSFPFEELFFWMLFYAATILSLYKIFIDTNE